MGKLSAALSSPEQPNKTYFIEYAQCVLFFVLLFAVLAVASFDPLDASLFNVTSQTSLMQAKQGNLFGPWGASLADWSFQLFGLGALLFSFVFIAQLLASFRRPRTKSRWVLRAFGYPQLVVCYLGLIATLVPDWNFRGFGFATGGLLGNSVSHFFVGIFGARGAAVALAFGTLASFPLCLGVRPVNLITQVLCWVPWARVRNIGTLLNDATDEKPALAQGVGTTNLGAGFGSAKNVRPAEAAQAAAMALAQASLPDFAGAGTPQNLKGAPPFGSSHLPGSEADKKQSHYSDRTDITIGKIDSFAKPLAFIREEPEGSKVVGAAEFGQLLTLLEDHSRHNENRSPELEASRLRQEAQTLEDKLATFGVLGKVIRSQPGPVVNVHEFEPAAGIKVTKVMGLQDDLALGLKAQSVLMAPQPGKSTIGIEIPAQIRETVSLRDVMESSSFKDKGSPLPMALGQLVDGSPLIADLSAMPHLLIAGATGSGKSVGINVTLLSLMMSRTPQQLRLILVDPKMLELSNYDGIGHLLMPVVTEPHKAAGALKWAIDEMERRYKQMRNMQVRNIANYNTEVEAGRAKPHPQTGEMPTTLPYIVVVIDELCDLMMTAPKDVEDSVQRLAQKARAAGIHLILATQRPSVDVLTGVIKANLPCRLSFQVASKHDSRTIIETVGAEKLLGRGDMLFLPPGTSKLVRAHCAYVGDKEINAISDRLRELYPARYETAIMEEVNRASQALSQKNDDKRSDKSDDNDVDGNLMDENVLYDKSVEFAVASGTVSTSSIQRHFRIGYNRAARLMDRMVKEGLVGPSDVAGKPRQVIGRPEEM